MKTKIIIPIVTVAILASAITLGFNLIEQRPEPKNYNDVIISLERQECFGPCPVYTVTVFEDGTVIYEGKKHVSNIGTYQYQILRQDVNRIIDKFHDINFFALNDRYERDVTDNPTTVTTFQTANYTKTVTNYANAGPQRLQELESLIDKLTGINTMNTESVQENKSTTLSIYDMKPNSMEFFYYPNPENTENRDAFQKFILIRLPEWLGGGQNNTSAFRAYSAVSLTDHCLVKYWPDMGRQRMENPCRGELYRPVDGAIVIGADIMVTSPMALPRLDLAIQDGKLSIEPPTWTPQKNGVISIGKEMSIQEIRQGSQYMIDSFAKNYPHYPKIPLTFEGYTVSMIYPDIRETEIDYFDFASMSGGKTISMSLASAQDQQYFLNLAMPDSEFWQLGDHIIRITANDRQSYKAEFFKSGYKISITGDNSEFMRKEISNNYFPEYDYGEMFLVSRNMK